MEGWGCLGEVVGAGQQFVQVEDAQQIALQIIYLLLQLYINSDISSQMQTSELFSKCSPRPLSIKVQNKEDFFAVKKNQKRLKISQCFSEPIQKKNAEDTIQDIYKVFHTDDLAKNELQSTFGSESVLAFKIKPLKRKKNIKLHSITASRNQCESQSDNQVSLASTLRSNNPKIKNASPNPNNQDPPLPSLNPQPHISQFQVICKLGEGTYSNVFRAVHKPTGFLCALKVLQKFKMIELNVVENILREIKINYFLDHPNIAKIYSFFDDRNYIYLVCEYATDKNIHALINQPKFKLTKGLFSQNVSKLLYQLCDAVKFIHNHSVLHRDIKPQNILLTMFDTVKLCDFGWSVYNPSKEMRSTLCGTPLYLAPELIRQTQYDQSVDIWAIGVLTYEMLTKENPFKIVQFNDLCKVLYDEVRFQGFRNKLAVDFIKRALQKDSSKRKTIYQLINHPFLGSHSQNASLIS